MIGRGGAQGGGPPVDLLLDALGGRVGFTVDGRPVSLVELVRQANVVRRREGLPDLPWPCARAASGRTGEAA